MGGTILSAISASAPSRSALVWSARRAVETGSALTLIHVIDVDEPEADGRDLLEREVRFARSVVGRVAVVGRIEFGVAPQVLTALSSGFGILVLGTHKTGYIHGRTFGSRFLGLAEGAHCVLAVIPDRVDHARRGVVVGVENSPSGDAALRFAIAEASRTGQDLVLVAARSTAHRGELLERATSIARAEGPAHLRIRSRGSGHGAAEALVDSSTAAAVLVLGRGDPEGFHATNHDVLVNIASPVIVVPLGA
jgi:hypothetical protein